MTGTSMTSLADHLSSMYVYRGVAPVGTHRP